MKRLIATIHCAIMAVMVTAQTNESDSIQKILSITREDTSRMWLLIKLAREFESSMPDSALVYARQALQIALLLHPYIADWTNHTPVFMLLILVAVASILVPMHHRLETWIKHKLAKSRAAKIH